MRVAIIGGGPSGLIAAYYLRKFLPDLLQLTIFEASSRLGGKICTHSFENGSVLYEAGVAELYNYAMHGEDPLRDLVETLGLETVPMAGKCVVLGDAILNSIVDVRKTLGPTTAKAIEDFYRRCKGLCSPYDFYADDWEKDNRDVWSTRSLRELIDEIPDAAARRYIESAIRSDVASEPDLTNGLTGLKNILMEEPEYMTVYSIKGGIERLVQQLHENIDAEIHLKTTATAVLRAGRNYKVRVCHNRRYEEREFEYVICALPNYWLSQIDWPDADLRAVMRKHLAHYDHPAHYLRVTLLFREPFWRSQVKGSYFMSDAFGGCCVYDETARHPHPQWGVLGWLIAGSDALSLANLSDAELIERALDALPQPLAAGRELCLDGRVYRWVGTVNALPGGSPIESPDIRHSPSPSDPDLYLIGDYFYDSTLNGVVDSAEFVAASIAEDFHDQTAVAAATATAPATGEVRERA